MQKKIGRNNPCPCGSGKKYKKCCLKKANISSVHREPAVQSSKSASSKMKKEIEFLKEVQAIEGGKAEAQADETAGSSGDTGLPPQETPGALREPVESAEDLPAEEENFEAAASQTAETAEDTASAPETLESAKDLPAEEVKSEIITDKTAESGGDKGFPPQETPVALRETVESAKDLPAEEEKSEVVTNPAETGADTPPVSEKDSPDNSREAPQELPVEELFGLSYDQFTGILNENSKEHGKGLPLKNGLSPRVCENAPLLKWSSGLFHILYEEGGRIKTTNRGYLSRKAVKSFFWKVGAGRENETSEPSKEIDYPQLMMLRELLEHGKLLEKRGGYFYPTPKGEQLFLHRKWAEFYTVLLNSYYYNYDWLFGYNFPTEYRGVVQNAGIFHCLMLSEKAKEFTPRADLEEAFLKVLAPLQSNIPEISEDEIKKELCPCFYNCFLKDFASNMGLLEEKREKGSDGRDVEFYKTTELFEALFDWKLLK